MSCGGTVTEVIDIKPGKVWVNTVDGRDECAVICDPGVEKVQIGDKLWWQGSVCYWTPKLGDLVEVKLKKTSGSGISKRQVNLMLANGGEMPE